MLSKTAIELLYVLNNKDLCTLDYLTHKLNLSKHTLLNALDEVDDFFENSDYSNIYISRKSGEGIKLIDIDQNFNEVLIGLYNNYSANDYTTVMGRCTQIILWLINAKEYITLQELADKVYVSKGTIINDMEIVKSVLSVFHITIESKRNNGIRLKGSETNIRKLFSSIINEGLSQAPVDVLISNNLESLYNLFEKELVDDIRILILETVDKNKEISNIQISALLVHVMIAIQRIKNYEGLEMPRDNLEKIRQTKYFQIALNLVDEIEGLVDLKFTTDEIAYIAMHFMCSKKDISKYQLSEDEYAVIDIKLKRTLEEILEIISLHTDTNAAKDKELIDGLILHLRPSIDRLKHNLPVKNPYLNEIKKKYLKSFEIAVLANEVLKKNYSIDYNEDEIAYIALHIEAHVERSKELEIKNIAVVCVTGIGTSQFVMSKLRNSFKSHFKFHAISAEDIVKPKNFKQYDLILSTVPLDIENRVYIINPILSDDQMDKIEYLLNAQRVENHSKKTYKHIFDKENIHIFNTTMTKEDMIIQGCENLVKKNYVTDSFEASVFEREAIASTAFGNIAIPHGHVNHVKKPTISILTCNNAVDWDGVDVKIVFLISLNQSVRKEMNAIFDFLYDLTSNLEKIEKISLAKSSEEILKIIQGEL